MILVLVESSNALTVDHQALEHLAGLFVDDLERLVPDPEAFCAGVDGRTDPETAIVRHLQQNSVQQK